MNQDTKIMMLLAAAALAAFLLALAVLETLLAEAEFVEFVFTDPVPPWMAAQVQEEARGIIRDTPPLVVQGEVLPDDAQ